MNLPRMNLPRSPAEGTLGTKIKVRSNFFTLEIPNIPVYHYSVSIRPDVPPAKNRKIFLIWEEELNALSLLDGIKPVYDGRFNMYSPKPIFGGDISTYQIDYYDEEEFHQCECPRSECYERKPKIFEMTLTRITTINMDKVRKYLKGLSTEFPDEAIQSIDIILQHRPALRFTTVGHDFFTDYQAMEIKDGLELWQGLHQSVIPGTGKMLVNLDVSASAFHTSGPVLEIVSSLLSKKHFSELKTQLSENDINYLDQSLHGLKIVVTHRGQIRRKYRIESITYTTCDNTFFKLNDGANTMSVAEYFQMKYEINLAFPFLPCILVGSAERPVYFPLELCQIVHGQRNLHKLNEHQTREMIKFTCQPPHVRSNKISAGMTLLQQKDDEYLSDFGIKVGNEMLNVPCRVLPAPTLSFHPASKEPQVTPRTGIWNLRDKQVAQGATLISWGVIVFSTEIAAPLKSIQKFVSMLCETCEECGLFMKSKQPPISYASPMGNIEQSLVESYAVTGKYYDFRPQLLFCILPNTGVPLYAEIKRVSDTIIGVGSQCAQIKHIFAPRAQYCANICLKMNVKLGGMNAFLSSAQLPFVSSKPTIVIGVGITRPTVDSTNSQSIAAMVGTLDAQCSRYSSTIRTQIGSLDVIEDIGKMFIEILRTFFQKSGVKPQSVLLYRDCDSQFHNVADHELNELIAACETLERGYRPKITYVTVQKRHHARFFPFKREDADRSGNVKPGTVIDRDITNPALFDFYLISHPGLQGTSKPCYYAVYHDENDFTADGLQELSYRLCFLYCRATRSISVVPPVYYAHIVATRARFHYSSDQDQHFSLNVVKDELNSKMYFI